MTAGAARRRNPLPAVRSASTPSLTTAPAIDASVGSPSQGGRSRRKAVGRRPAAPPIFSRGRLGGVRISMTRGCPSRWAPHEGGSSAGPVGQGELLFASSRPQSCRVWPPAAVAMMTLRCRGEAMMRTTPTCRSSRLLRWQRRRSTSAQATGLHWRRRQAPPPSAS
jgi:hypothetical protein